MAQHDYLIANGTGAAVRDDLNNALAAIVSQNSGTTAPTMTYAYMPWADTTTGLFKIRNAANNDWITLYQLDGEWSTLAIENGSASAPSIYFKDSGTDTGIYSSGTDAIDFSAAGTRRFGIASGGDLTVYGGNVTLNAQGDLRFADSDSSNWVAFQSPATVATNVTWTLPSADGTNGQALTTNGSGTLSWGSGGQWTTTGSDIYYTTGKVLVGTSTSITNDWWGNGQLQIVSSGGVGNASITTFNSAATWPAVLEFHRARGSQSSPSTVVDGDFIAEINFFGYNSAAATPFQRAAQIRVDVDGTPSSSGDTTDMPGRLVFSTTADGASSPTERMRIAENGLVWWQSTSHCHFAQTTQGAGTTYAFFNGRHSASGSINTGTSSYYVYSNGNVQNTNGSYTAISDAKLKENIADASSQWHDLKSIKIRNWNFKAETGHETHRQIGPIAQELEQVCPNLVFETPDRDAEGNETGEFTKGVNQSVLYMKAVKALQEAMERIEQLEQRLADAGIA